jgi:hypothetical protein
VERVNAFALALVVTALAGSPVGQRAKQFAAKCGVTIADFRERVFADGSNDKWKEYGSAKEFPAPESEWFEVARIWTKAGLPTVVEIEGIGQDFSDYTLYCFDGGGVFSGLDHEFRTEWDGVSERSDPLLAVIPSSKAISLRPRQDDESLGRLMQIVLLRRCS